MTLPEGGTGTTEGNVDLSLPFAEQERRDWEREQEEEGQEERAGEAGQRIVITEEMRQQFYEMMEDMKRNRREEYDRLLQMMQ